MAHTALNDEEIKEYFDTAGTFISFSLFFIFFIALYSQLNLIRKSKL
jgi:hypothetical protein